MSGAPDKSPARIASMFDAIAARYDLLNHVLSAGLDRRWRRRAVAALALKPGARVLDVCTGTADLALAAAQAGACVIGVDFSTAMLAIAREKTGRTPGVVALIRGDATSLPIGDAWADGATIGFGIRNVAEPERALREIARALKPGARLAILEFGEPTARGLRPLYGWYFREVLPRLGRLVSHHQSAYSYLPASVGAFPPPAEFAALVAHHGFSDVRAVPLSFGIVYLYSARRV
ncbi:MAG TPA: bifunctional demethylmenaquinone methyltransferase/2-methoxy-6-polyprenyl-1,4-benzoquinol methylase UbiE [Vicinamibacterales bacterium]|nr:bifunctional demethylmenaquinone methyltransferase/2-methoxy-6-polyprenyl-1,4-benzoquinol methylase UbiE [Vicinamibacterales bacterium]